MNSSVHAASAGLPGGGRDGRRGDIVRQRRVGPVLEPISAGQARLPQLCMHLEAIYNQGDHCCLDEENDRRASRGAPPLEVI